MRILMLISLLVNCFVNAQVVNIPDPAFKQRVIALGFDTNSDNQIQLSEAQKVTKLYLNDLGIVNVQGINSFTNLEELGVHNNKLQWLDISGLVNLKFLYAQNNRIERLQLGTHPNLEHLYIQGNFLLPEVDVSKLNQLKDLRVSNNKIKKLATEGLNNLEYLDAENNLLATVSIQNSRHLKFISLKNNSQIQFVDIRGLADLEYFNFEGCSIQSINFSGTIRLKEYRW